MTPEEYNKLLNKLDSHLLHRSGGISPSVSPTHGAQCGSDPPGTLYTNMDIEKLSENETYMVHTNLHRFYPEGIKEVKKEDIEQLHLRIRKKMTHHKFDMLDENDGQY